MVGHSWNTCPINGKGGKKGGGNWNSNWNSNWNGFKGKGGGSVWATEWDEWKPQADQEIKFGNQAAEEYEPQEEDDLGAVDVEDALSDLSN